ncbi:MAG: nitrate- and nitrite sensing domain-containing protein [Cyclobacteriaceae bacterium]|nr:nitrate- and nitrite sensing domain-containing protein [Cyclobacteriaceae bacterium SS2]
MKRLHNLSIKRKFALVLIPLIVTIICFDILQIRHDFYDYQDARRLNKAINIGIDISHLVHEIQKERSISVGFQANSGESFHENLVHQRQKTDSLLSHLYVELRAPTYQELLINHGEDLKNMKLQLEQLLEVRSSVDQHTLNTDEIISHFSEINKAALNTVNQLINETRDKTAAQQVHAIIYFLDAKEYASIERALGTYTFSTSNQSRNVASEFASLISSQEAYLDAFLTISDQESKNYYFNTMQGADIQEVERFRAKLNVTDNPDVDPTEWYTVVTGKINSLKQVEDFMLENMHNYTENMAANARRDFFIFLLLDFLIGFITFTLVAMIVLNLIKNVAVLEKFTREVTAGKTSERVAIDTRDEIGHYANTFNIMLDKLISTQSELKQAKDHAEYMYENIYKQSEVVFENVEQGIFLLDKDLKISSLYSKAVEKIFDNEMIASENFCNFMRPRIMERDFEALQMFMKHLFNPDMDEEVVNQLNPVEEVQIYITKNGVVISKHIRVSFTRIVRGEEIQSILVTITDETESVLLQQHMKETENMKKQDTEYLFNILKVDPGMLQEFIKETRETLKSISDRYEQNESGDLNELLKYTYRTVHKIKGNAMTTGVELVSNRVHKIEDSITKMMDIEVTADKFLSILYELEEINKTLTELQKMLEKVGEIYKNLYAKNELSSKEKLENDLRNGLQTLCKETEKEVDLDLRIDDAIDLDAAYLSPVKDILNQMMRNSISHGIEDSEERISKGKQEIGKITVALSQADYDGISVTYEDDGRGIDTNTLMIHALASGLISHEESEGLDDHQIAELLTNDGFSTTTRADKLSGRGQGMSVIKSIVEEMNGSLKISFKHDRYFRVTVTLPNVDQQSFEKVA